MRDVAQFISDLATQLDVQLARSNTLASENAGLKESRKNLAEFIHEELDAGYPLNMDIETPATDAFPAEVRAQGVEMLVKHCEQKALEKSYDFFMDAGAVAAQFAYQLRKGVQS